MPGELDVLAGQKLDPHLADRRYIAHELARAGRLCPGLPGIVVDRSGLGPDSVGRRDNLGLALSPHNQVPPGSLGAEVCLACRPAFDSRPVPLGHRPTPLAPPSM